ncbi:acyl-CoA/acyl-ACP dehydrogenase [Coleofasciculus sp. FACHB-64]|uniref:acyl-CoA dehydrogenase family protein n=1 Tax=Cyanophyceae TaxID=3028117 RepID=UPI0016877C40|nr:MULTISPECIES: acyl-CoA dehydrogenase family protein [unclassified Coleofasciculus]MBD1840539.1 acyl-CoA/acyl-ACP dehydrogenase [Coleofasciculus sp. FACHB-501]MBD1889456.1 acyl-CoA/acyl-ACP dehydrogenase [Coleofasciculus sp. FACHB-SPT9]MBD2045120.1 acyl-CoA/acyl-ACP dehydrogenase [Coleofasciculus sp. FACHB-64]
MDNPLHLLDIAESYLRQSVAPLATEIDSSPEALGEALKGLGERSLLALRVPQEWGGSEVSEQTFRTFQELIARYSGALAFLQTQHQSASGMLVASKNCSLKCQYLPRMSNGQILVGVGFSQLRRQGDPTVKAFPVEGGYHLEGQVPWVTGWGLFQEFIVAATLPDGGAVFGIVPFVTKYQEMGGAITFTQPMQLAVMTSTNTVTANLTSWFLPQERVVSIKPAGWIHENDLKNVLHQGFFALGCARAGLDILEAAALTKPNAFISKAFKSLDRELTACSTAIRHPSKPFADRLQIRAWAIDLAVRCAHAAVTVSRGAANYSHHAAQRVYREALVFTVSGQTTAVMEATLNRLVRSESALYLSSEEAQPGNEKQQLETYSSSD